ncbi:MAG: prolyl-tRNA synthetase associated domain-containing protein [Deltaproteobacteria bacterium]
MHRKEKVYEKLNELNIEYKTIEHPAAFTVEDITNLNMMQYGEVCKNLFLRDAKGERHFLIVLDKDKNVDLKTIQGKLACTRLGFASEERLYKYLNLNKGEVTPLAVINDLDHVVEVVIDNDLKGKNKLGFHPNENTATVIISYDGLVKYIEQNGNTIHMITL